MQILDRIDAISSRAAAINLPLGRLCASAGVHHSTIIRWRAGGDIRIRRATEICERLEKDLATREAEIRRHLEGGGSVVGERAA